MGSEKLLRCVYLSGGIKDFTPDERHGWRQDSISQANGECIDPTRMGYDGRNVREIVHLDKSEIDRSTHVLVYFIRPSVGTSMEVLYAWERGKKVYLVNDTGTDLSPWLIYHSTRIFATLKEAIDTINAE